MTNKEKYAITIGCITAMGRVLALKDGVPCACSDLECGECDLNSERFCYVSLNEWLNKEYKGQ